VRTAFLWIFKVKQNNFTAYFNKQKHMTHFNRSEGNLNVDFLENVPSLI